MKIYSEFTMYLKTLLILLLYRLFSYRDIIFYFYATLKKIKKNLGKVWTTFENIIENGAFAPKGAKARFSILYFEIYSISMVFLR